MTNNFNLTKTNNLELDYFLESKDYFRDLLSEIKSFHEIDSLDHHAIKKTTKYLVNSFGREEISREALDTLLKILLSSYIQLKFDEKFIGKNSKFHRSLSKSLYL